MFELIVRGGWFMVPILLCSTVALAVLLERLWTLRRSLVIPPDFLRQIEHLIGRQKVAEAVFLCQGNFSSIARIFLAAIRNVPRGGWAAREAIQETGSREAVLLEKRLGILSTIAHLSPLLGLLGTVSGMIKSFNAISLEGLANPQPLAGGISEALITTAAGLCVAIPTLVAHRFLKDRAAALISEMEENSGRLLELIESRLGEAREAHLAEDGSRNRSRRDHEV